MSNINNTQQQVIGVSGQNWPDGVEKSVNAAGTGAIDSSADTKARLQVEADASSSAIADSRAKALASQGPQDISAAQISKMMVATGAAGLGSSLPELPTVKLANPAAAAREAAASLPGLNSGGIMLYSAIEAANIVQSAGQKSFDAQAKAHALNQQGQMSAQMDSAKQAEKKATADKGSAVMTFIGSGAAVGATGFMAVKGSGGHSATSRVEKELASTKASSAAVRQPEPQRQSTSIKDKIAAEAKELKEKRAASVMDDAMSTSASEKDKTKVVKRAEADELKKEAADDERHGHEKTDHALGKAEDSSARRAGMYAASAGAGQLVTSGMEAMNQNLFFGKESHDADIAGKFDDVLSTAYKMGEESFKTGKEKAQKMIDDAISALKQHFDLVKSTNDRIG